MLREEMKEKEMGRTQGTKGRDNFGDIDRIESGDTCRDSKVPPIMSRLKHL